jgi:hypothetical protein
VATNHDDKAAPSKNLRFIGLPGLVMSVWSSAAADAMMLEDHWQRNILVSLTFPLFPAGTEAPA